MSFADDLKAARVTTREAVLDVAFTAFGTVQESLVRGSALTGAAGQPVDTGALRASFTAKRISDTTNEVSTSEDYAPAIEDGIQPPYTTARGTVVTPKPMTLRSEVGGFHSAFKTAMAWPDIVADAVRQVNSR